MKKRWKMMKRNGTTKQDKTCIGMYKRRLIIKYNRQKSLFICLI